ncbi:MAG: SDR family oxidoreductase [Oscillospiraceae bacterium]|nr:SDR family oxidoreductase [Oscillospiraceae bacterium]
MIDKNERFVGRLDGSVCIVTGGAMGMGAAASEMFIRAGGRVVIADFNEELGRKQVQHLIDMGGEAAFVKTDVSKAKDVAAMVQFAVDTYGELNVALNNAARTPDDKPLAEMDEAVYDALMSVDLKGVALCLKYELAQMVKQGKGGSIINTSSVSGIRPQPGTPLYVAAKHGVIGLTKAAAVDYSHYGIRVNAVAPGAIDTPMLQGAIQQFGLEPISYAKQLSMLGRFGTTEEVAKVHLWLASEDSSFVTGATIAVDGGYTAM